MGSNNGSREYEVGLAVPLWLPGERSRSGRLVDTEAKALDNRFMAAPIGGEVVRERWWNYYRAEGS